MATELGGQVISVLANEDLSSDQYRFVVKDATSGKVRRPDSANEVCLGVLQNAPASGAAALVMISGISKFQAAGAAALNALITAEYVSAADAGKGLVTTTAGDLVRGIVVEAAGAEDDLGSVRLTDLRIHA